MLLAGDDGELAQPGDQGVERRGGLLISCLIHIRIITWVFMHWTYQREPA